MKNDFYLISSGEQNNNFYLLPFTVQFDPVFCLKFIFIEPKNVKLNC